jgi:hypothetical protein
MEGTTGQCYPGNGIIINYSIGSCLHGFLVQEHDEYNL